MLGIVFDFRELPMALLSFREDSPVSPAMKCVLFAFQPMFPLHVRGAKEALFHENELFSV